MTTLKQRLELTGVNCDSPTVHPCTEFLQSLQGGNGTRYRCQLRQKKSPTSVLWRCINGRNMRRRTVRCNGHLGPWGWFWYVSDKLIVRITEVSVSLTWFMVFTLDAFHSIPLYENAPLSVAASWQAIIGFSLANHLPLHCHGSAAKSSEDARPFHAQFAKVIELLQETLCYRWSTASRTILFALLQETQVRREALFTKILQR